MKTAFVASWFVLAFIVLLPSQVRHAIVNFPRATCVPGSIVTRWNVPERHCVQFCNPDRISVYPLCMIPHPQQPSDAWKQPEAQEWIGK